MIVNSTRQAHGVLNGHVRKAIALQARSPIELFQDLCFKDPPWPSHGLRGA